jgi:hypothetical protein
MDWLACICVGVHRITASSSWNGQAVGQVGGDVGMPYFAATSRVLSSSRLISEITSTSGMFLMPSRCLMPKAPAPARATLMVMESSLSVFEIQNFQNQVPTAVFDAGTW